MKRIRFDVMEPVDTPDGVIIKESVRYEDYPDEKVRHRDLCTVCGWSTYPECREWCPNEKRAREREAREQAKSN